MFWGFLKKIVSKYFQGTKDTNFFLNLLYFANLKKLLCERRDKMSKEECKTVGDFKNGKFHLNNLVPKLARNIFLFLSHPSILL